MSQASEVISRHPTLARRLLGTYSVLSYLYLFAPILLIILFSFNTNRTGTLPITGFTLRWYRDVFEDASIQNAFLTTLSVAVQVTICSTMIGTAAAFPLVRARFRFRSAVRMLLTLPIMLPGLLIGVALLIMFTDILAIPLSIGTVVIGQSVFVTPFVILLVAAQLQGFDQDLERAASDLGANSWQRLRHIVLPLIMPAIIAAACFSFILSVDEFIITLFLIGPGENTLPIYIFTQIRQGITPSVNALVSMMLGGTILLFSLGALLPRLVRRFARQTTAIPTSANLTSPIDIPANVNTKELATNAIGQPKS
jgi:spermidine/putrescine transport system permease protein